MNGHTTGGERPCPDDLVVRGQREELTEIERRALTAHLGQCAACRASSALTALFDAIPETQPGDADLIARVADKALPAPHHASRWRGARAAAVAALAVLTCGAATAAWVTYKQSAEAGRVPQTLPAPHARTGAARGAALVAALPGEPAALLPAVDEERPAETTPSIAPQRRRQSPSRATDLARTVAEPTPASLFAEANAVRRTGDVRLAIGLYQSLRQHFPKSSQALVSAISVGDLLLGEGEPANAIAAYGAYLRGSPTGSLTEEALFGRARGLGLLGRSAEERQTWEELLRRFPRSAYQPAASRRLKELAR
jgi:TolA-binding protein